MSSGMTEGNLPGQPILTDDTEDWLRARTWDFYDYETGLPIEDLEQAAAQAGADVDTFAADLLRLPFGKAAPQRVIDQAFERLR